MRKYLGKNRRVLASLVIVTTLVAIAVIISKRPGKSCFAEVNEASCNNAARFHTSSAHAPIRGLFLGYTPQIGMETLLEELVATLHGDKIHLPIVIVYPQDEVEVSVQELSPFLRHPEIRLVKTTENEGIWTQDFMDIWYEGSSGKEPVVVDLPYRPDEGDQAPVVIAQSCAVRSIAVPSSVPLVNANGSYGGNIDNFAGTNVFGSGITPELLSFYETETQLPQLGINSAWLRSSHLDELFALVPNPRAKSGTCKVALLRASPASFRQIIASSKITSARDTPPSQTRLKLLFDECVQAIPSKGIMQEGVCSEFWKANETYERIIVHDAERLRQNIETRQQCSEMAIISVPVIFQPQQNLGQFGGEFDDAVSAFPNLVNGISLNEFYYTAKQPFKELEDSFSQSLASIDIKTRYLNADLLHQMGGGIHCWTQTVRSCQ